MTKIFSILVILASALATTADADKIYANRVCVQNKVAGNIKFRVHDSNGNTVGSHGNYPTSQTQCTALSSTPGTQLQLKVYAYWGKSKTISPVFEFGQDCTITFKCAGTVDSYSCQLQNYCTPAPTKAPTSSSCVDPVLSDVTYYDAKFAPKGFGASTTTCNNTNGAGTLGCTAEFSVMQTTSETVTATTTNAVSVTGTVTFKEQLVVAEATQSISVSYTGTFSNGHSKTSSESMTIKSSCTTSIPAGSCSILQGSYVVGTLQAKWKGTMTCADGSSVPGYGNLTADNAVSKAQITDCTTTKCPVKESFLGAVKSPKRLRGVEKAIVTAGDETFYDQFCVKNSMSNNIHFSVYNGAGKKVASFGDFPVGQTKCTYLTSDIFPDNGMQATVSTYCWGCHNKKSHIPNFSYMPGAKKKLEYECFGTQWDISCSPK